MAALGEDLPARLEAYLLGRLSDADQARIEALLFEDDGLLDALRDAEDTLIDRYLAAELTPADREAFEHTFATSATRQQRIAFARLLSPGRAPALPAQDAAAAAVVAPARARRPRPPVRPGVGAAGALVAVALVAVIAWWITSNDARAPGDPGTRRRDAAGVASLRLGWIEARRGTGSLPRLLLPRGTTTVCLEPELEAPPPVAGYAVTVRQVGGPIVWQGTLRPETARGRCSVTVPAQRLVSGDYVLRLGAAGAQPEAGAEYPFRVVVGD